MGWLSDKLFGKRKRMDINHINNLMKPTQDLISGQIDTAQQMQDPNSMINMRMRNLMSQRSAESGAQAAGQMQKTAAMSGMSPGQAMMQQRMAMNQAMGGVNQQWQQGLQGQMNQGTGLLSGMIGEQRQMDEGQVNAYMGQINASNAARQSNMNMGMQIAGNLGVPGFSDRRLKTNIKHIGKSPKGYNVYEFDYKDSRYGPDRYRGVMSDEVSFAAIKDASGYDFVNYSHPDLDVNFERIS
jgi:hypothetical protein